MRRSLLFSRAECSKSWLCSAARNDRSKQLWTGGVIWLGIASYPVPHSLTSSHSVKSSRNCVTRSRQRW